MAERMLHESSPVVNIFSVNCNRKRSDLVAEVLFFDQHQKKCNWRHKRGSSPADGAAFSKVFVLEGKLGVELEEAW